MELHIAFDDADSPLGQCTTYITYLVAREILSKRLATFLDYPHLIRLNPNIPFKTRGNAATALHLQTTPHNAQKIVELAAETLRENAEHHGKTSPALAVLKGKPTPQLRILYSRALRELVPRAYLEQLLHTGRLGPVNVLPTPHNRGLVGALAALGAYPLKDYTYELLAYRDPRDKTPRKIPATLLKQLDRRYRPLLFATYDYAENRPLAVPHGPDPVLLGLRSLDPRILEEIASHLAHTLPDPKMIIYKTNQATDAHLTTTKTIAQLHPYDSARVKGTIAKPPQTLPRGHVKLTLTDHTGTLQVMVYKETGRLNRLAKLLAPGDTVEVAGGLQPRHGLTLNAEQILLWRPAPLHIRIPPRCPRCGHTMKSAGRGKGYKCPKCGYKDPNAKPTIKTVPRPLDPGLYTQSPRAYRHLTRPPEIRGLTPLPILVEKWIYPPPDT